MDARSAPETDIGYRITVRPNRSLTPHGMMFLLAGLNVIVLTVGVGFTLVGAWPILPFAGLEMVLVSAVVYRLWRHSDDHEAIEIERDRVRVKRRRGSWEWSADFQRYWTQVRLEPRRGRQPSRLKLGSHGRYVTIAADVNEDERVSLSSALKTALRE